MRGDYFRILGQRDFWPLFGTMSLGAFNDNLFRQALISMLAYGSLGLADSEKSVMGSLATGLMILPFFLFSSLAGQLADRHPKSVMVRMTKIAELGIMILAGAFFLIGDYRLLIGALFLMGAQSTFFGPMKYGLLPEVLQERDLVAGNGLVGGASFILIVLGTMAGSYLMNQSEIGRYLAPALLILVAGGGLALAMLQPRSAQFDKTVAIEPRLWKSTWDIISSIRHRGALWLAVLAISWFWAMGSVLLTQLPVVAATRVGDVPALGTALVTLLALGVAVGAMSTHRLLKGRISASLTSMAALAMTILTFILGRLVASLPPVPVGPGASRSLIDLAGEPIYLGLMVVTFLIAAFGGLFVVPLNALLQHKAGAGERARVIAANNIINALGMVVASGLVATLMWLGLSVAGLFTLIAATALAVTLATAWFLPEPILKAMIKMILRILYRPRVRGLENLKGIEGPVLIVPNHTSFADVALLVAYLPWKLTFAIDSFWARRWWVRACLKFYDAIPINPAKPIGARDIIDAMGKGATVVIFPEGKITTNGCVMKLYEGPGLIASRCEHPVIPVIFQDLEYTVFGKAKRYIKRPPKKIQVSMTVMEPVELPRHPEVGESRRGFRRRVTESLYEVMVQAVFKSRECDFSVWTALRQAAKRFGSSRACLEDVARKPMTYGKLTASAKVLGRKLADITRPGEYVGVLLPNSAAQAVLVFGLWAGGRVPVMLNFSQGRLPFASALKAAEIKTIVTSRAFIKKAGLEGLVEGAAAELFCLEDLRLSFFDKLKGLLWRAAPAHFDSPAAVVFTSGSEGRPKGVVLSHKNLLANGWQARSIIEINEDDSMFNAMPAFHAFGLNVGMVLPLVSGIKVFLFPSPLQVKTIPELIYDFKSTVVIGSDAFAAAWGREAHPYDFFYTRIMILGAERLKPATVELFFRKLSIKVFEGYGVSEAGPIVAIASRMRNRPGSPGRILPGIEHRVEPVPGLASGGRLLIRGPNVMMGYITEDNPGSINARGDDWHDTGDICELDDEGYLWIRGRFKRFAKISGEMISLAAVEEAASGLWPDFPTSVVAAPDPARGERLVLLHTPGLEPDLGALRAAIKAKGLTDLAAPRSALLVDEIPLNALGKPDMPALQAKIEPLLSPASASAVAYGERASIEDYEVAASLGEGDEPD